MTGCSQGERIGMIKFGSRVEVYLPAEWEVAVEKGQRVRAGETVVGSSGRHRP